MVLFLLLMRLWTLLCSDDGVFVCDAPHQRSTVEPFPESRIEEIAFSCDKNRFGRNRCRIEVVLYVEASHESSPK